MQRWIAKGRIRSLCSSYRKIVSGILEAAKLPKIFGMCRLTTIRRTSSHYKLQDLHLVCHTRRCLHVSLCLLSTGSCLRQGYPEIEVRQIGFYGIDRYALQTGREKSYRGNSTFARFNPAQ
jgi:hypothetical protein